jgi:hypothetical protein
LFLAYFKFSSSPKYLKTLTIILEEVNLFNLLWVF